MVDVISGLPTEPPQVSPPGDVQQELGGDRMDVSATDGGDLGDSGEKGLEVLVLLPSGSVLPMRGVAAEPMAAWKSRLLGHCGVPLDRGSDFGLSLGYVAINEEKSATANDVCQGDSLILFERATAVRARETELANLVW